MVLKNAIKSSQISYYNEYDKDNNALIHSSFIDSDYENKLNDLLLIHGKKNIKDNKIPLNTVVGTRCISTSLDISFKMEVNLFVVLNIHYNLLEDWDVLVNILMI